MSSVYFDMMGIEDLIDEVLDYGVDIPNDRTGTMTKAIFDAKLVIPEGEFPFTTNLMASPRLAFEELWFFMRGETDTTILEKKGINFWRGNTSREFLDGIGLTHLPEGDLGSAYSRQWRDAGGTVGVGVDQLENLVNGLRDDPYGRRHIVTLWNPVENEHGCINPCWHTSQYVVLPDRHGNKVLHVKLSNRSLDIIFGARFAVMQYRLLQMALCKMFGFKLGTLSCDLSHVHIYENQIEYAKELLTREYVDPCESDLVLIKDISRLEDLLALEWSDWDMIYETNTKKFVTPRPPMVA